MNKKDLQIIKKLMWCQKLASWQSVGKIRSNSWGGKKTPKQDRRASKKDIRNFKEGN